MTRPSLHEAVAGQKSKASEYNENFNLMMGYVEDTCSSAVATVTNKADKSYVDSLVTNTKNELTGIFNTLASSGTISLTTNSVNTITPSGAVTFSLPNVSSDTKLNQILVQVNLTTVVSINVGTTHYFNNKSPNLSTTGKYNLIFEYDELNNYWVCGWMRKG